MGAIRAGVKAYHEWLADEAEQAKHNKEANMVHAVYQAMEAVERNTSFVPDEDPHNINVGASDFPG